MRLKRERKRVHRTFWDWYPEVKAYVDIKLNPKRSSYQSIAEDCKKFTGIDPGKARVMAYHKLKTHSQ